MSSGPSTRAASQGALGGHPDLLGSPVLSPALPSPTGATDAGPAMIRQERGVERPPAPVSRHRRGRERRLDGISVRLRTRGAGSLPLFGTRRIGVNGGMRRFASPLAALLTLLAAGSTRADWPMARHDVRRTAVGDGTARIARPAASLRHYLGGSLGSEQYLAADVDGDGRAEVIFLMGGALIAKTPDDAVVWETDALDLFRIDGIVDLDGDGTSEIVLSAVGGRVHAVRVSDGAVRWSLPSGVVGNVGAVRFADFDDDGTTDLYLAENACGSTGSLGDIGVAYSFAGGLDAPSMLFQLERGRRDYICGANDAIADVDGDGRLEVIAQGLQHFYVYSSADGSLESTSEAVGSIPYGGAMTRLADVDGDGRMEIVAWTNNSYAPPLNSRRVFLMDWDEASGTLVKRWERSVTDLRDDRHGYATGGLEDFGGDGRWEIVTSFYSAETSAWTTVVLDARTGAQLDSVPRGPFRGLVDLDARARCSPAARTPGSQPSA